MQQENLKRIAEVVIELLVADSMEPHRRSRRHHEIKSRPKRSAAKGAGSPPGSIDSLLRNVDRTKPQVALGSSFKRDRISSALMSSVMGVIFPWGGVVVASAGVNALPPMTAAPFRTHRRSTKRNICFHIAASVHEFCTCAVSPQISISSSGW